MVFNREIKQLVVVTGNFQESSSVRGDSCNNDSGVVVVIRFVVANMI